MDKKIIQSYVFVENERYFVSTIERDSSAILGPDRYNETLVFDSPDGQQGKGKLLSQHADVRECLDEHFNVCQKIFNGEMSDDGF